MIVKVIFTMPKNGIPIRNQAGLNSYIHHCLGSNNKYHDSFSDYAISSIQGGKLQDNGILMFSDNPYIQISSENVNFITDIMQGIQKTNILLFDMKFQRFEISNFNVGEYCDTIQTLSPILLKDKNDRKITIEDDNWLELLIAKCKSKLAHKGIVDDSFNIVIRNREKSKKRSVFVGNTFNFCTYTSLKIYGQKKTRETLYNMGLGQSTGCGFGSIFIYKS